MSKAAELRLALARATPEQGSAFYKVCLDAYDGGLYEELAELLGPLVAGREAGSFRAWQILGLALRGLQDSAAAHQAFERAARLAPEDPLIAHSQARTALEAGYPATRLFEMARARAPRDAAVLLGQSAAMLAEGDGIGALHHLAAILDENPGWHEGHAAFAKISAMVAPQADRHASLRTAVTRYPGDAALRLRLVEIAMQGGDYQLALDCIEEARKTTGAAQELDRAEAICRNETGDARGAKAIFDRLPALPSGPAIAHLLRNLIRLGALDEATRLADSQLTESEEVHLWPYRALIWRAMADPRWEWLEGDERLIGVHDLSSVIGSLEPLSEVLRSIHRGGGAPIDQSVRGGTQTDGNVLARAEPEIRQLRAALLDAVESHIARLPPPVEGHPTLLRSRRPVRIEGAWSVRLVGDGFHADHVHPQGWLSSAFYVALPENEGGIGRAPGNEDGWLAFGECRALLPDLAAFRTVEPKVGTFAVFPSTMWHGTRPFASGERMTVALDIARPALG